MKPSSKSAKLLLSRIFDAAKNLVSMQKDLSIGELISLVRKQLNISQRALSKRAKVPQSLISIIESQNHPSNISTLEKLLNAMDCELIITVTPRKPLEKIKEDQAKKKAIQKIGYLQGTMSLEKQTPDEAFIQELIEEETKKLLNSSSSKLWEEE